MQSARIHLTYSCVECAGRILWVGFHSEELFAKCVMHPCLVRMVLRVDGGMQGRLNISYDPSVDDADQHPFFRIPMRSQRDLVHVSMEMLERTNVRVECHFLARRVYLEVAQVRIKMWLRRRRRAACLAFAMGAHPRLGRTSAIARHLSCDIVGTILRAMT